MPRTSLQCCYILSGPSGSLMQSLFSVENWVPLKPVLGAWGMLHLYINPRTHSIKPNLQCSCYFVVINASEGLLCFQFIYIHCIYILHESNSSWSWRCCNSYTQCQNSGCGWLIVSLTFSILGRAYVARTVKLSNSFAFCYILTICIIFDNYLVQWIS
jgi:hypothetical protein